MRFHGSAARESFSGADRTNLPDCVVPGTDYRDVRVDYLLATRLRSGAPDAETEAGQEFGPVEEDPGHGKEPEP